MVATEGDTVWLRRAGVLAGLSVATTVVSFANLGGAGAAMPRPEPGPTPSSFSSSYSVMKQLKWLASTGKGEVAAILSGGGPAVDGQDLTRAFTAAGLSDTEFAVQNAAGSDAAQFADAETDITNGATVLLLDPINSGVGAQIEALAQTKAVKVIDYDTVTLGGSRAYYVGFDNELAGRLMGQGLISCVAAWGIDKPQVVVMSGAANDPLATQLASGYEAVLAPRFKSGQWTEVAQTTGTWNPSAAEGEFRTASAAHPGVDAALIADDAMGVPIITYLQGLKVKPRTVATTGFGATVAGLRNVLNGYQCGTVYEPIDAEAQAAVALALYLRDGRRPPASLLNGSTVDTTANVAVPSVLVPPVWVTTRNMNATVVRDGFVTAKELCAGSSAAGCTSARIKP
jgi:D-xylose transport system substrate-binding protein